MSVLTENIKNFGKIKAIYNGLLVEGVITKDNSKKQQFKKYVSAINENEILKTEFLVFTNIENKVESDPAKAADFVRENIELFSKFDKKDIYAANATLIPDVLFEQVFIDDNLGLYENITTLIFTRKTPDTVETILEARGKVVDYIVNNKAKVITEAIELPNSMISKLMVEKYNEKYSVLDESEKQILKAIIDSTDEVKKTVYGNTLRECIDLIDDKLGTTDLDAKDKLLRVKDRLLNDKHEINEDFIKNISKLVELRTNLKATE